MKFKILAIVSAALALCAPVAHSAVIYQFSFTDLHTFQGNTLVLLQPFSIGLRYDNYVTVTGMNQLPATLTDSTASLGYPISYAGTNQRGDWGMSSNSSSSISNGSYVFAGNSFLFSTDTIRNDYFRTAGTYNGYVSGNVGNSFAGIASLTIREDNGVVPEPGSLALLALGIAGLAVACRRQA